MGCSNGLDYISPIWACLDLLWVIQSLLYNTMKASSASWCHLMQDSVDLSAALLLSLCVCVWFFFLFFSFQTVFIQRLMTQSCITYSKFQNNSGKRREGLLDLGG